ncbi:hypothetical protein ABZ565_34205 [Streptomyces sp. NPDC016469]|uniref:hypothetical protein n=1 Tax=Streptomyces sp. NPDC016469 TaxID=3157191 RepID=UPI0033C8CFD7
MNTEKISPDQIARAAAEGVAIALAARNIPGDIESRGPIVAGFFPEALFEVMLERDAATGGFQVNSIEPYQPGQ